MSSSSIACTRLINWQAVYNEMLPRLPLRFLLADDPGAGKTIMSGLYIRELIVRGDLERCLVLAPGIVGRAMAGGAVDQGPSAVRHQLPGLHTRARAGCFAGRGLKRGGVIFLYPALVLVREKGRLSRTRR